MRERMTTVASDRVVFDLELGRGFGYALHELSIAGFAIAVTWDARDGFIHWEGTAGRSLLLYLLLHDEIVGFNVLAYDNTVLSGYLLPPERAIANQLKRKTYDLHSALYVATGQRHSLQSVAMETLGVGKLPAPKDWDIETVAEYCERDVELTRDLDDFRRAYGVLYARGVGVELPASTVEVAR